MRQRHIAALIASMLLIALLVPETFAGEAYLGADMAEVYESAGNDFRNDRAYVSPEGLQKVCAAQGWDLRDFPDTWRDFTRVLNVLYFYTDEEDALIRPKWDADRQELDENGDAKLCWQIPIDLLPTFYSIRIYYKNAQGPIFYISIKTTGLRNVKKPERLLDNGIYAVGDDDKGGSFYAHDMRNTMKTEEDIQPQYLWYRMQVSPSHMNEEDITAFLSDLP